MRSRTETVIVPEERYEQTTWGCDFCDFEDTDKERVQNHHAKNHAVKKEQEVNGTKFYWFDSKEDAELWIDPPGDYNTGEFTSVLWTEPGWYGAAHTSGIGRCRCGRCYWSETSLRPLAAFVEDWRKTITNNESNTEARLAAIEAATKL